VTPNIVGREAELQVIREALSSAKKGAGSTVILSGEAGIGKSRLVEAAIDTAREMGLAAVAGAADSDSMRPFLVFSGALSFLTSEPLFEPEESAGFGCVVATGADGGVLGRATPGGKGGLDAATLAGMLAAVQNFVKDSFGASAESRGLGRLEYGDRKIIIERSGSVSVAAILEGAEHPEMRAAIRKAAEAIVREPARFQAALEVLAALRFRVQKSLEGVKLENERSRIANRVLEVVRKCSAEKPLLLVLEDLHWADESSLFVLRFLARNLAGTKAMVLATSRPSEGTETSKVFASMREGGTVREVALQGLDAEGVRRLVDSRCSPNDFDAGFAERLHRDCAGNPFFITELLKQMESDGAIASTDGMHSLAKRDYAVPSSVGDVVRRRLETLDPGAMALAEYASCIGREFQLQVALSAPNIGDATDSVEKLDAAGIVCQHGESWEFSHALFQSAIYDSLAPRWRAAHHRSIGEYYEMAHSGRLDGVLYELARHFSLSGERSKTLTYCVRAGEKAEGAFAAEQAIGFYGSALDALGKALVEGAGLAGIEASPETAGELKASLWEKVADNLHALGRLDEAISGYGTALLALGGCEGGASGSESTPAAAEIPGKATPAGARLSRKLGQVCLRKGDYGAAMEHARRTLECAEKGLAEVKGAAAEAAHSGELVGEAARMHELASEVARSHELIGAVHTRKGDYDEAVKEGELAVRLAGEDKRTLARTLQELGTTYERKYEWRKAVEVHEQSLRLAGELGDLDAQASATGSLGIDHKMLGEYDRSIEYFGRTMSTISKTKDVYKLGAAHLNLGTVYYRMKRWDEAIESLRKGIEIQERIGNKQGLANGHNSLGIVYDELGRWPESRELHERSLAMKAALGDRYGQATSYYEMGSLSRKLGELERSLELFDKSLEILKGMGNERAAMQPLGSIASVLLDMGETKQSFERASEALRLAEASDSKSEISLALLRLGAALAGTDPTQARKHLERAMELAKETEESGVRAEALTYLARIDAGEGMAERGVERARESLEIFRGIGAPLDTARAEYELGMALARSGNTTEARGHLSSSEKTFASLGARFELGLARRALEGTVK
jgi:tetratricopeptide (TPR) repeat protein